MLLILRTLEYATSYFSAILENWYSSKIILIMDKYVMMLSLWHNFFEFFLQVIKEIIETCRAHDFTDVILVHEHRGVPDGITISHLPFGPTAYFGLLNVVSMIILVFFVLLLWLWLSCMGHQYVNKVFSCRLQDMTLRTRKPLEQCLRLTHI